MQSPTGSADSKSVASKTSINVKLPDHVPSQEELQRTLSTAESQPAPPVQEDAFPSHTPDYGIRPLTTTPVSSKEYLVSGSPTKMMRQPNRSEKEEELAEMKKAECPEVEKESKQMSTSEKMSEPDKPETVTGPMANKSDKTKSDPETEDIIETVEKSLAEYRLQEKPAKKSQKELIRQAAATIIERAWIAYRDKQMFRLLKHAVCAAENSLSKEILRKVCPKEAELLSDKSVQVRVRFRFGGGEFPPMIFFKVFIHTAGKGVKYMSGRKLIKPASEASEDSLRLMGNRQFYDQMLRDAIFQQQYKITDEIDVTTLKDYMQYLANTDETPASMGGKENYWRKLTLDDLSRRTIFYDIVDFLYNQRISPRLAGEIPILIQRPLSQEIKIQHIRAISRLRSETVILNAPLPTPKSKMSGLISGASQLSSRRSRQAKIRAMKMRKMYGMDKPPDYYFELPPVSKLPQMVPQMVPSQQAVPSQPMVLSSLIVPSPLVIKSPQLSPAVISSCTIPSLGKLSQFSSRGQISSFSSPEMINLSPSPMQLSAFSSPGKVGYIRLILKLNSINNS
ncbi:uncharacterized protein CXorf58 homolog [Argopecten irradians]|uniref:uncharacterized protein CXorf58 homolog n=1 Tax=Argopecten irradians TaxID=31199 RepID=UPI00371F24C9